MDSTDKLYYFRNASVLIRTKAEAELKTNMKYLPLPIKRYIAKCPEGFIDDIIRSYAVNGRNWREDG